MLEVGGLGYVIFRDALLLGQHLTEVALTLQFVQFDITLQMVGFLDSLCDG